MSDLPAALSVVPPMSVLPSRDRCGVAPASAAPLSPSLPDPARSESELVREAQGSNPRAFAAIVQLHSRRVYHFLHQMTRQHQDAQDLTQQTFIKAYHGLDRFDPTRPLINWLLTIARRTALNHFRSARKWETVPDELASTGPSPARVAEERDQAASLWARARLILSQREFAVLWLRFGEELSVEDTARVAGLTQTHVKVLVYRARQQMLKETPAP